MSTSQYDAPLFEEDVARSTVKSQPATSTKLFVLSNSHLVELEKAGIFRQCSVLFLQLSRKQNVILGLSTILLCLQQCYGAENISAPAPDSCTKYLKNYLF